MASVVQHYCFKGTVFKPEQVELVQNYKQEFLRKKTKAPTIKRTPFLSFL